ncbi:MAG: AI-2E family transporter, partial [Acidimicrobiia bacterium]
IGLTVSFVGFLLFATTVALFSFYMIAELPQLQRTVLSFMNEQRQRRALRIWDVAVEKMGGYIYSRLILAVVSAAIATIFLGSLDVDFALPLGIWVGTLSQFVPVVGTYLASILPALVALTFNDLATAIWVVVFFIGYQQVENYLISPRITKRTMEIHPAVSVGAILIGATLMGGLGVILALPMAGIIQAIISESRKSYDVILDDEERVSES